MAMRKRGFWIEFGVTNPGRVKVEGNEVIIELEAGNYLRITPEDAMDLAEMIREALLAWTPAGDEAQ
jgi:hypothetical protein